MDPLVFDAIGTSWKIQLDEAISEEQRQTLMHAVLARIGVFDRDYSRFRDDSLVTEMSLKAGTYRLPDDAGPMMDIYRALYDLTDGRLTPLIGQVLADAGYDANYSLRPKPLSRPPRWDDVMAWKAPNLALRQPALLDFGGAGKGYLIDIVGDVLLRHGVRSFLIDAGQDLLRRSAKGDAVRVGLENPHDIRQVIGVTDLADGSICGSAGNRRAWGDYHHLIDPATLMSPRHLSATWVYAKSAMVADALATALFFVGPEVLHGHFAFEYLMMYPDSGVRRSPGFRAELFTA